MSTYTLLAIIFIALTILLLAIRWTWSGIYFTKKYQHKAKEHLAIESFFNTLSLLSVISAALAILFYYLANR